MKPLSIWYHTRLSGGDPEINPDQAMPIMAEQMGNLRDSGLEAAATELHIVSNGGSSNLLYAAALSPDRAILHDNGPKAESHLPTVNLIRSWLPAHVDHYVCYFHIKGVTHPRDALNTNWRRCMDWTVITQWQQCIRDLDSGYDSVGPHWLTPEKYPGAVKTPFWGGMFFWATAKFLMTLPPVPEFPTCRGDWFKSEGWIGDGPKRPRVRDYRPHWPGLEQCRL